MIIQQCDICKRYTTIYDTMILYKKSVDYCIRCKSTADKMRELFKQEAEQKLRSIEAKIVKRNIK